MSGVYVVPLADPRASLAVAGGKGASLARLAAAGLPVPGGFHITTAAYQQFVTDNNLQTDILTAVQAASVAQPATLEVAAGTIHGLFTRAAMPCPIVEAISRAYAGLGDCPAMAVRSSATAEDLPGLSFAGQQETYLNVHGCEAVLAAVKQCWASLWTARAIGYRARHGIDQGTVSLAVVVQRLVCAEAAGVLFTANPLTGQRETAMITAAWGLGEAIVGGLVTPDTLTIEKATGRLLSRETAEKRVMTVRDEQGTRGQPTPDHLRRAPVLDDAAAVELARLGVQIEQLYGQPMDIEWARVDGKFAILQARPITALPPPETAAPAEWKLPHTGTFMRGSIVDFMPEPLSPLFATLGRSRYNLSFQRLMAWFTGDPKTRMTSLVTINGYGYLSVDADLRSGLKIIAVMRRLPQLMRLAVPRWRDEAVPRYDETVDRWQARPLAGLTAVELVTGIYELLDAAMDHLTTLQGGIMGIAGTAEAAFAGVYDRLIRREGDPQAAAFVLGYDSTPILADKALYDLAHWCHDALELAEAIRSRPAEQLAADLASPLVPLGLDVPAWRELQTRWRAHLEHYGAMVYSLDFARPLPADEPAPLLEALKLYVSGPAANPYERQQKLAKRREAVVQATLARLKGLRLKLFRTVLGWAQAVAPLREDGIAYLGHGYPQLRRMLRELGSRLARAGAVQQPDDIFWLIESEVQAAAAALDQGQTIAPLVDAIQQRQAEWQAQKRLTPPPTLPPMKKLWGINIEALLPARGEDQVGATLKGVAASPGVVTAPACVLRGPEDFDQMRPGSILVAEITTPAWTPLFAMAAAVVTDIGGPLSHGSIVAREYGLPAVMGTGVATRRIHSGQTITVDGSAGLVTLSNSSSRAW